MENGSKIHHRDETRGNHIRDYWPLLCLILVAFLGAVVLTHQAQGGLHEGMHFFMGFFLCQFGMLKLFDPKGFADGFQMYDLIAQRSRLYAQIYPLIELTLGLSYLGFFFPRITYALTALLMAIGIIGVSQALKKGLDLYCPCMGNILKVPLSTVTLTENVAMGLMALTMLLKTAWG